MHVSSGELRGRGGTLLRLLCLAGALSYASHCFATDDVVTLRNGDRITGEIKKLERGELHIKPNYGENTFVIDWKEIASVDSQEDFLIELSTGQRINGTLSTQPEVPSEVTISGTTGVHRIDRSSMVVLNPVQRGFWGRLGMSIEGGFDFTKTNSSQSTRLASALSYQNERWTAAATLNVNRTMQNELPAARRREITLNYRRFLWKEPWFGVGLVNLLTNDEQRLSLRSSYGGGLGRPIFRSNRSWLVALGGIVWTNEDYTDPGVPRTNSAEGLIGAEYNAFKLGDVRFLARAIVYPSLSQSGRVRFDFNSNLKWDLPRDFYLSVYFWSNYDSSPVNRGPNIDLGSGTAVGWEF